MHRGTKEQYMKIIFLTMAAAISVATPATAQSWQGQRSQSIELQTQIDAGVRSGTISRSELPALRDSLRQLTMLERQLGIGGLTGREHATLQQRGNVLRQQISFASQTRGRFENRFDSDAGFQNEGRAGWEARYDSEHRAAWDDRYISDRNAAWDSGRRGDSRFAADSRFEASNRGDRFAGDVRIGQRASRRMVALPDLYRGEFRDSDQVYYRYDSERVYEIDRNNGLIVRLFDLID
jgi:hypothetical protein